MAGMYDVAGVEGDIKYKVIQTKEREFLLTVVKGNVVETEVYSCEYPTLFGLDVVDSAKIEDKLGKLIEKVKEMASPDRESR